MPTTAGSLSLKGMMTRKDAFVVKRLRDAGAVMIAKSNMAEFAFSPVETVNSILPGYTRNPYDTSRVTAGSSGGSAAAAAANFGAVALASDTGDSIRAPASHQALVGLRSTMGLVSRAGVVPLNLAADIAGAVTRTVADTAAVLQVIAGEDPNDPVTAAGRDHVNPDYMAALRRDGLKGARLGVLHQAYDTATPDPEVDQVFKGAFRAKLRAAVVSLMNAAQLDALVYPTWSNPPRLIGDLNTPGGDNNQFFAPSTGFPAITVPMGYTRGETLPAGLQFFGRPWTEATLLRLAYAYEQATHHRRPPALR